MPNSKNIVPNPISDTIGKRFKAARLSLGLTQIEFAKELNVRQSYLSAIEQDKKKPSLKILERVSDRGFNIEWLLTGRAPDERRNLRRRKKDMETILEALDELSDQELHFVKNWIVFFLENKSMGDDE